MHMIQKQPCLVPLLSSVHSSGFEVKVVASDNYIKRDSGLVYRDFEVGKGDCPKAGQQVFLSRVLRVEIICTCCLLNLLTLFL